MEMFSELAINVSASILLLGFGYLYGKYRERRLQQGKVLEEYDFYPFELDENKILILASMSKIVNIFNFFLPHIYPIVFQ